MDGSNWRVVGDAYVLQKTLRLNHTHLGRYTRTVSLHRVLPRAVHSLVLVVNEVNHTILQFACKCEVLTGGVGAACCRTYLLASREQRMCSFP